MKSNTKQRDLIKKCFVGGFKENLTDFFILLLFIHYFLFRSTVLLIQNFIFKNQKSKITSQKKGACCYRLREAAFM